MSLSDYYFYNIINYDTFMALDLPSQELSVVLQEIGLTDILVTRGRGLGVVINGVFLMLNLNDRNPFEFDGYSIYIDNDNEIWLGVLKEEET